MKITHPNTGFFIDVKKKAKKADLEVGAKYYLEFGMGYDIVTLDRIEGDTFIFSGTLYEYPVNDLKKTNIYVPLKNDKAIAAAN